MLRKRFFSLTVAGCVIVAMLALTAGCSMDSGNPLATTAGDSEGVVALDKSADHPESVSSSEAPGQVLAKRVRGKRAKKNSGGDEKAGSGVTKKGGPARYSLRSR